MKPFLNTILIFFILFSNYMLFAQTDIKSANTIKQRLDSVVFVGANTKIDYLYNNEGKNSGLIHYTWNNTNMRYEKDYKREYTYNSKGLCGSDLYYNWNKISSKFDQKNKVEMNYDEHNQLLLSNYFDWDITENKWIYTKKIDFENTFDVNGNLTGIISYQNTKTSTEIQKFKYEYIYGANKRLESVIQYEYASFYWRDLNGEFYSYDTDGKLSKITSKSYSAYYGTWHVGNEYVLKYDSNSAIDNLQIPNSYFSSSSLMPEINFKINNKIISQTCTSSGINLQWTERYYYSQVEVTRVNTLESVTTKIFPNPTTDFLNIQWQGNQQFMNIELYDIKGISVFSGIIENYHSLPIKEYHKGLYILKISDGNIIKTEKVYFE